MELKEAPGRAFELVLLVDDGELDNFLHQKVIERAQFAKAVVVKTSARSALNYLTENEHCEEQLPELIFLDINMPGMNGFQFLEEFKGLPDVIRDKCQIMVLSSSINQSEIAKITKDENVLKFVDKPLRAYDLTKIQSMFSKS